MTDTITHLPGCNMKHDGGNWAWTCRNRMVVTFQPQYLKAEEVAEVTVDADGPCSGGAGMTLAVEYRMVSVEDLDQFMATAWPEVAQAVASLRETMADWNQRSQCQHPEDQDCPE